MRTYINSSVLSNSTGSNSINFPSYNLWTLFSSFFRRSRASSSQHYLPKPAGLSCILDYSQISGGENEGFVFNQLRLLESNKNIVFPVGLSAPKFGFLLTCFRCNKNLKGLDVYVYRGEKSYCSAECRSEGIKSCVSEGIKSCVRNEEMECFRQLSPSHQTPSGEAARSGRVIFVVGG